MGEVYVAEQLSTGKQRALKLMHHRLQDDPKLRERFVAEARVASKIDSLHAVEIIGAGVEEDSGTPWLAMELLVGDDLADWLRKNGAVDPPQALVLLEQICHAVGEGHDIGIVHRDLKPENVFMAKARAAGQSTTVKVLDFGIAKLVADTQTMGTAAIGSPAWMAPEQAEAGEKITPAADVWALGLLTFWMLTGRSYWRSAEHQSASMHAFLKEVLFEPLPRASERAADRADRLPEGFDAWFERCVHREPRARFKTAREMLAAFANVVAGEVDAGSLESAPVPVSELNDMSTEAYLASISGAAPGDDASDNLGDDASDDLGDDASDDLGVAGDAHETAATQQAPADLVVADTAPAIAQTTTPSDGTAVGGRGRPVAVVAAGMLVLLAVVFAGTRWFGQESDPIAAEAGSETLEPTLGVPEADASSATTAPDTTLDTHAIDPPAIDAPSPRAKTTMPSAPAPAPTVSASAEPVAAPFNKFQAKTAVQRKAATVSFHCKNRADAPPAIAVTMTFNNDGSVKNVGMDRQVRVRPAGMCVYNLMRHTPIAPFSGAGEPISISIALK
jgi:tRNA A-37 threonylcarbamoyl transferase component Bud32